MLLPDGRINTISRKKNSCFLLVACLTLLLAGCDTAEERAQEYVLSGKALLAEGDPIRARLEFRNALKQKEGFVEALVGWAEAEEQLGEYQAAVEIYASIAEQIPDDVHSRLRLAVILTSAGALDQAREYAGEARSLDPEEADVLVANAALALKLDNHGDALRFAHTALEKEPEAVEAIMVLALERLEAGAIEEALQWIDQGLSISDQSVGLQYLRLLAYEQNGDDAAIGETLQDLVDANPQEPVFWTALARWHTWRGQSEEAEAVLRRHVAARPEHTEARLQLIAFLKANRGAAAAIGELEPFADMEGAPFVYQMALAELLVAGGASELAVDRLNAIIATASDDELTTVQLQLARIHASRNPVLAVDVLDTVLDRDPEEPTALALRGKLKLANRDMEGAIEDLTAAVRVAPSDGRLHLLLAEIHERTGAVELAEESFYRAIEDRTQQSLASRQFARHLLRYGKGDQAGRVLKTALQIDPGDGATRLALARLNLDRADYSAALDLLASPAAAEELRSDFESVKASALAGLGQHDEALSLLAGSATADSAERRVQIASLRAGAGDKEAAVSELKAILDRYPDMQAARNLAALLEEKAGRLDRAETILRGRSLESARARLALVNFLVRHQRIDEANEMLRKAVDDDPDNNDFRIALAKLLEKTGQIDEAIVEYEILYLADPRSALIANNLAAALSASHDDPARLDRASEIAARFRTASIPEFVDTLGWIELLHGNDRVALPLLRDAATKLPDNATVQFHYGVALGRLNRNDEANAVLAKAMDLTLPDSSLANRIRTARVNLEERSKAEPTQKEPAEAATSHQVE